MWGFAGAPCRDGLSGSNSYNFIAQGFDGVLVEPFPEHQQRLVSNLRPYMDSTTQRVQLVKGVVSDVDGRRTLNVFDGENSKTSNTVLDPQSDPTLARWKEVCPAPTLHCFPFEEVKQWP